MPWRRGWSIIAPVGFVSYIKSVAAAEAGAFPLFVPVFIGTGVAIYFGLPVEPGLWLVLLLLALVVAAAAIGKTRALAALALVVAGLAVARIRTAAIDTYFPPARIKGALVSARAIDVELTGGDFRITFDRVRLSGAPSPLDKVRIRFPREDGAPEVGDEVSFTATLLPPFAPQASGAFDFRRYSYFKGYSASGRGWNGWSKEEAAPARTSFLDRMQFGLRDLRARVNARIERAVAGPSAGVLISMMTGGIYAVQAEVSEAYKGAGISHLLSISGFHMTLVAGIVFFLVRRCLAFFPRLAARRDTKKTAAVAALFATLFYLMLSGARLPTLRAFIMVAFGMLAVLFDRSPFSMRFLAASGTIMLAFMPEAILNPGFQMSFMAVAVLVRLYEIRSRWLVRGRFARVMNPVAASVLPTFCISIAIAPFVVASFGTAQPYAVLGNLFAVPIAGAVAMPLIVAAFVFMPLGLDAPFLKLAALALDLVYWLAAKVAALPYADLSVKPMDSWALSAISLGVILLLLLRTRARFAGPLLAAVGLVYYFMKPLPDVLADRFGTLFGVVQEGRLALVNMSDYKPDRLLLEAWRARVNVREAEATAARRFAINGRKVAFAATPAEFARACADADIVFSTLRSRACAAQSFDRGFFARSGGAEFFIDVPARSAKISDEVGARPWR